MAHHRERSTVGLNVRPNHALSLKVLRLSRPSLAIQSALPATHFGGGIDILPTASLAYPTKQSWTRISSPRGNFPLTPLLTFPPAFGAAYVGEEFACTICVNNELFDHDGWRVSQVRIVAEMQSPGADQSVALALTAEGELGLSGQEGDTPEIVDNLVAGATIQRSLHCKLQDDGPHQLAVTVTYLESSSTIAGENEGRKRTFRKLYQFAVQPLIAIRSKITECKRGNGTGEERQWLLETQLENVGETSVVIEHVRLNLKEGVSSLGLNRHETQAIVPATVLKPQDVDQMMFLLLESDDVPRPQNLDHDVQSNVRTALAQVHLDWRATMGEKGSLTTAWLVSRGGKR